MNFLSKKIIRYCIILLLSYGCHSVDSPKKPYKSIVDSPSYDTSNIEDESIRLLSRSLKKVITDDRESMIGVKLSFQVPKEWEETVTTAPSVAYHFYDKKLNISLQVGVSKVSQDSAITSQVRNKLTTMFQGFLYDRQIVISGKKALQIEHSRTIEKDGNKSYVNTSSTVFFSNYQLIIFTFGSTKINSEEDLQKVIDLRLLYRHLAKTIKIL